MATPAPTAADYAALLQYTQSMEVRLLNFIAGNATALQKDLNGTKRDLDIGWLILCGALVFFMQAGFAMLEAGIVQSKNMANILFKNAIDVSIAAVCYWLVGYGIAFGDDLTGFIGRNKFITLHIYNDAGKSAYTHKYLPAADSDGWEKFFFQWTFSGACATIVAGSMAERTKVEAYFVYSIVLTSIIYPVVVHWGWGTGWLSAWGAFPDSDGNVRPLFRYSEASNGIIDFAGSGVVHMVGGFAGLMGAIIVGPRTGRFENGHVVEFTYGNKALQALGTFILWFGWYGFNCGSTLALSGGTANVAAKVAFNTTLAPALSCLVTVILSRLVLRHYDLSLGLNGVLAGLVSITAGCAVVEPWMSVVIGAVGGFVFFVFHFLVLKMKIDDPCDACVVHGFVGVWGLLAPGVFCTDKNVQYAGYPNVNNSCGRGEQFGVQVVGCLCICAWTLVTTAILFLFIQATIGLRASLDSEEIGMDCSEHGAPKEAKNTGTLSDFSKRSPNVPPPNGVNREQAAAERGREWSPHVSTAAPLTHVPPVMTQGYPQAENQQLQYTAPAENYQPQYTAPMNYSSYDPAVYDRSRAGSPSKPYPNYTLRDEGGVAPAPPWPSNVGGGSLANYPANYYQRNQTGAPVRQIDPESWNPDAIFDARREPGFA